MFCFIKHITCLNATLVSILNKHIFIYLKKSVFTYQVLNAMNSKEIK